MTGKPAAETTRPAAPQAAIAEIVRVFEEGYHAALALRGSADLTPSQLQSELDAIELGMLRKISRICERSRVPTLTPPLPR